jgi:hypothetical protein
MGSDRKWLIGSWIQVDNAKSGMKQSNKPFFSGGTKDTEVLVVRSPVSHKIQGFVDPRIPDFCVAKIASYAAHLINQLTKIRFK